MKPLEENRDEEEANADLCWQIIRRKIQRRLLAEAALS